MHQIYFQMTRMFSSSGARKRSVHILLSYLLELGDGLGSPEDPLGGVGSNLGGLAVGPAPEQLVELCDKQLVRTAEVVPDGHAEREVAVVESLLEIIIH